MTKPTAQAPRCRACHATLSAGARFCAGCGAGQAPASGTSLAPETSAPTADSLAPGQSYAPPPYPAQPYPAQPYPAQSYPAQSYPAQSYPAQSYPAQSYPAQQFGGAPGVPPAKSVALAVFLTFIWLGAGQLYVGQTVAGVLLMVFDLFLFLFSLTVIGLIITVPVWLIAFVIVSIAAGSAVSDWNRRYAVVQR